MEHRNKTVTARATVTARNLAAAREMASKNFDGFFGDSLYQITAEDARPSIHTVQGGAVAWECDFEAEAPS